MLILPLHHPLDRRHLPWATALLVLINLFVFMALQRGDPAREALAREAYVDSGLAAIEVPPYLQWLDSPARALSPRHQNVLEALDEPQRWRLLSELIDLDDAFQQQLAESDALVDPARWRSLRESHEARLASSWTWRLQAQSKSFDPLRLIGSAFLHANWGHLLGNMLFLVMLGMLVEGAVGGRLMLVLYVVGAIGASLASVAWRWGEPHAGLGASGSVAAVMGAYCLIWGMQRVRFFHWVVMFFDYVRAPALVLFPLWLGWEIVQLLAFPDAGIGFDAHAGGLLAGAAFGLAVRRFGAVDEGYLEASDSESKELAHALLAEAEQRLGALQMTEAEDALARLHDIDPELAAGPQAQLLRYRCARYANRHQDAGDRLSALLMAGSGTSIEQHRSLLAEACSGRPRVSDTALTAAVERLLGAGRSGELRALLKDMPADLSPALQPRLWLKLALAESQGGPGSEASRTLAELQRRFPGSPEAAKARVLLG
jgi:membrane associated rhomboid family serine protease